MAESNQRSFSVFVGIIAAVIFLDYARLRITPNNVEPSRSVSWWNNLDPDDRLRLMPQTNDRVRPTRDDLAEAFAERTREQHHKEERREPNYRHEEAREYSYGRLLNGDEKIIPESLNFDPNGPFNIRKAREMRKEAWHREEKREPNYRREEAVEFSYGRSLDREILTKYRDELIRQIQNELQNNKEALESKEADTGAAAQPEADVK